MSSKLIRENRTGNLGRDRQNSRPLQGLKSFCLRDRGRLGNEGRPILLKIGTQSTYVDLCNMPKFQLQRLFFLAEFWVSAPQGSSEAPCIRNPRPQCARQSKPCYPVNHLPFHRKQCISVVRVDLPRRKEAIKVFIREVNSNNYIINTVLPSSYT